MDGTADPISELLEWFSECDFAILEHGFAEYGRDYRVVVETELGKDPGRGVLHSRCRGFCGHGSPG